MNLPCQTRSLKMKNGSNCEGILLEAGNPSLSHTINPYWKPHHNPRLQTHAVRMARNRRIPRCDSIPSVPNALLIVYNRHFKRGHIPDDRSAVLLPDRHDSRPYHRHLLRPGHHPQEVLP